MIRNKSVLYRIINSAMVMMLILAMTGCGYASMSSNGKEEKEELVVFAAASLTEAFEAMKVAYELEHPETEVIYNFAGSQVLMNQIKQGATPAMFFSANEKYVDDLVVENLDPFDEGIKLEKVLFAANELIVIADAALVANEFEELIQGFDSENYIPLVVAAEDVPVGKYTKKMMTAYLENTGNQSGYEAFYQQIVSYESDVKAVLAKVKLHEAQVGLVYQTDAMTLDLEASGLKTIEIPTDFNQEASYASLVFSLDPRVETFYEFVNEGKGREILIEYGFK